MASTKPPNAGAKALFDLARADLVWLLRDGYTETQAKLDRAGFTLEYRSEQGAVLIGVHLAVSETVVMVGPPWITWLSDEKVDLRRVLSVRGLPVPGSRPPNRATRTQLLHYFRGYLEGLAKLRQDELAGDWTKYDVAKDAASDAEWRRRRELEACHGSSRPECRFRPLQRRRRSRALDRRQGSWCRACVTAAE